MRLIDADALMEYRFKNPISYNAFCSLLKRMPTINAEPVRCGHWIDTGSGQECSECKEIQYGYDSARNYCPNCGAKMDLEEER